MSARDMAAMPGYLLDEAIAEDERFRLMRARREPDLAKVLVKIPLTLPAPAADAEVLKREFEILSELRLPGITRALELAGNNRHCALVLEDAGGRTLAEMIAAERPPLGWILDYAVQLVAILAELHRHGIIHRGVGPRAILVDERSGRLRLTDFAEAARDAAQAGVPLSPRTYRSRLPYAAPEQTGRVSRVCDYRTDFYSFGVLLYELLAGRRPFMSDDPLELIHGHIAKRPPALSELDPAIPLPVSQIVMKLLAKAAEDRYQSALCLERDLQRCQREWSEYGRVLPFEIAERDIAEQFVVPQRLYGRDAERFALLSAFESARVGPAALLLVAGYAGIGKTALIRELAEPVARCRGDFVSGKFDQLSRDVPYSALIEALKSLVQRVLAETPQGLARRRERLAAALGANAAVVAEVIPEIELVLGSPPPVPPLPPAEAQNRFTLAFQTFLTALATPEQPLAVFLDDLQWIDSATLQLVRALLATPGLRHLLLIGAYRDNEVGAGHPLLQAAAALEQEGVPVSRITLQPLGMPALTRLCADTLHVDCDVAAPSASLVLAKTGGNPFFVTQFLMSLHQDGVIAFDPERSVWSCNLVAIVGAAMTENVIDLLSRKIDRLAAPTQRVLTLAACVGNRFDPATLATVGDLSPAATVNALAEAAAEGLIVPETGKSFVFLHDRVQQAAYARVPESSRPQMHLAIGRLLWAAPGRVEDSLFDVASHLNMGARLIESRAEKLALARLNLTAGRKAKSAAAFGAALSYFAAGIAVLDDGHWQSDYELAFSSNLEAAQCEYLCGNFDAAEQRRTLLLRCAANDLDRASVHSLRMVQFENMAHYADALASAREGLALFDVVLPDSTVDKQEALDDEVESIQRLLSARPIGTLIDLPAMTDPAKKMVMSILTDIWSSVYILGDAVLARLISAMLVRLSLEHGNSEESAYGYVTHAITVGPVREDYQSAYEFGTLALQVNERFNDSRRRAKIYQQFHAHVNLWRRPMSTCIPYAREACRSGLESGDFLYAAYGAATESWSALPASQDLAQLVRDLAPNLALIERLKNASFADVLKLNLSWARALQGETSAPLSLSAVGFDEDVYAATYRGNPFFTMFRAIARLNLCYVLEDYEQALQTARSVRSIAHQLIGMIWSVLFDFWNGLTLAASFASATADERRDWLQQITEAQRRLAVLAESCPENFLCQSLLLSAEMKRITGDPLAALDLYERAVDCADEAAHIQQQALANELFAKFWLDRSGRGGDRKIAALFMRRALDRYVQWGAHAKAKSLVVRYGDLLESGAAAVLDPGVRTEHELVDIATIVKAAHAIAENLQLDGLLRQMLTIAIENAGASRGLLIEESDGELFIAAEGSVESGAVTQLRGTPLGGTDPRCSAAVVNYVFRTRTRLVIADAVLEARFAHDSYLAIAQPRSILCVPIVHQGKLGAILYLENNLVPDAFNAERIEIIQVLMAQAATSLENARLFERMEREMTERQRAEATLRAIEAGTASVTGEEFFRALVRNLARALHVRYAFVAECFVAESGGSKIRTARLRSFWNGDDFGPDLEYEVSGTPCALVLEGELRHHATDLQALFPADLMLVDLQAQSYLGLPLVGSSGEVIGHMAILDTQPIADAARATSVLRLCAARAGTELERLKAEEERARALAEVEQLKNRLQEENVYLRRELIANVSHDLRSPLASLRGYLETLQIKDRSLTAADRRAYLKIATRQAEHLQTLISELFDLARLDFQGYQINPEPVHLGELARDVMQKFQLAADKKRIALSTETKAEAGLVRADIGLIERVLENLVDNAMRHTPDNGRVELAVLAHEDRVTVQVSDNGSGIPPSDLPHIFERFYQVDKARSKASGGSGLGLAIVKRIVELHGSEICVHSEPGIGTTFRFTLPAISRSNEAKAGAAA